MNLSYEKVIEGKNNLNYPSQLFINGKYQKSLSEKFFDNISPIDGKIINKVFFAQLDDIDIAVSKAKEVFNKGYWSKLPPGERKKILLKFATLLERDRLELSLLDTIDMGKTINDTYNADLPTSIDNIEWYAEIIDKLFDDISPSSKEYMGLITKEPVGVVAAIAIKKRSKPKTEKLTQTIQEPEKQFDLESTLSDDEVREDDKEIIKFIHENGGEALESELRKKFLQPRTTMWRAVKRLERQGKIEISKKDQQNLVKLKNQETEDE